jgi:hypothetical protein
VVGIVPMAMVLVDTKKVFQLGDGLGNSITEGSTMVVPDIFDVLEDLLFHGGHADQVTV